MSKKVIIAISVIFGVVFLAGVGVLIWWLVTNPNEVETISEPFLANLKCNVYWRHVSRYL